MKSDAPRRLARRSARRWPGCFAIAPSAVTICFAALIGFCMSNALRVGAAEKSPPDAADKNTDGLAETTSQHDADRIQHLNAFLQSNCLDCHDGTDGEGHFDLHSVLSTDSKDLSNHTNLHHWVRVFDRVNDGEMPPPEDMDVDADQRARFLKQASHWIDQSESLIHAQTGRVGPRRLTNDQLQSTLCDLLSIELPLAELIPDEQRTDGFRNIASAQSMSHYYLKDHLRVVDTALDYAFDRIAAKHLPSETEMPARRIANKRKGQRNRDPEISNGAAVVWASSMSFYGRISNSRLSESGWYRIKLRASSRNMKDNRGLWCSVRSGQCVSNAPLMHWVGSFEACEEPSEFEFTAWIEEGHLLEIRPADSTLKQARFKGGQVGFGEGEPQKAPGVAMHSLSIERIFPGGTTDEVRESLLGQLDVTYDERKDAWKLRSDTPRKDLSAQIRRFARMAFRSPVTNAILKPYLDAIKQSVGRDDDPVQSLRRVYRAILCSPRFVYFQESAGKLDLHAIANRLSYMLTGSAPDKRLRWAADQGKLSQPDVLQAQVARLLKGENLNHFVHDFTDQWLDLADIDFTQPDRRMHKDFDLVVKDAMLQETRRYLATLIAENRPASWLVDSDFTWLNNRLATYYGITDGNIATNQWKRVDVTDHPYRGGLMTHGSILKVTANGSNTSPVVRGVWVCDRLLGVPIPDPPENVPAIEPDVRGTTTVREMLEKHRSQVECAACHARIDPPGFALEHFDAAGRWRDQYLTRVKTSYKPGPKIDSAYVMRDGRAFNSFVEFRKLAAENADAIARNFAAKLLVYATGKEITFADRKVLDQIVEQTKPKQHRLRHLIEAVVTSETFLTK